MPAGKPNAHREAAEEQLPLPFDTKYDELTRRGRAALETQTTAWHTLAATIGQVLKTV